MTTKEQSLEQFPVGGRRDAVYDALRSRGFVMGHFGDKTWHRRDGMDVHIYGAGSMLMVRVDGQKVMDDYMAISLEHIDNLDAALSQPSH